jgi:SAM-dependent methyltransferase
MIETSNPEIDVTELMKRVRAEASKIADRSRATAAGPALPAIPALPPTPAIWIPRAGNPKKERLDELLRSAREKIEVSSIIPKFLRGLFRKQGGYNRSVLDSLSVLAKSNFELNKKVQEISTCLEQLNGWLLALAQHREAEANWMTAASSRIAGMAANEVEPAHEVGDKESRRALDSFYLLFENRFRGSFTEIKKRLGFYLPFLTSADAGTPGRPVLDLGCGRGEWLELLKENKLEAHGVDMNSAMIAQCQEHALDVIQADAIEYMRSLPANSHGGVTGFHIIEHLPFETLMELFGETHRILVPGGVAIFESPNCKNLVVGATNFNIDPTHRHPVFPETAELMLQSHGFEGLQIEYLAPDEVPFDDSTKELAILKKKLYGPQDFGIIAYKPKRG